MYRTVTIPVLLFFILQPLATDLWLAEVSDPEDSQMSKQLSVMQVESPASCGILSLSCVSLSMQQSNFLSL